MLSDPKLLTGSDCMCFRSINNNSNTNPTYGFHKVKLLCFIIYNNNTHFILFPDHK